MGAGPAAARIMAETCLVLPTEVAAEVEAAMLPKLPSLAAGQTRRAVGRQIVKADPEGAERRHEVRKRQREMVHSTDKPTAETERHVIARDGYCTFPS